MSNPKTLLIGSLQADSFKRSQQDNSHLFSVLKLFESEAAVQDMTVHTLSTLVFRLMAELELLHSTHHKQRLANFMLVHSASDGSLRMTQQQLAQHLGTTREVIARLMREFVAREYVQTQRGVIRIRDVFGLRRVITREDDAPGAAVKKGRKS